MSFKNLAIPLSAHLVTLPNGDPSANKILPPAALPQPYFSKSISIFFNCCDSSFGTSFKIGAVLILGNVLA